MAEVVKGEDGWPVLMSQAPGQVAPQPDASGVAQLRTTRSGNNAFDPASGRFANKSGNAKKPPTIRVGQEIFNTLTPEAAAYVQKAMDQYGADGISVVAQGNEAQIILHKGDANLVTFVVPTTNSDQQAVEAFNQQAGPSQRSGIPEGVTAEEWQRRMEAVRDAAREMHDMSEGDARDFLQGRAADMSLIDIQQFVYDVRQQRLDDLADVLDQQLRGRVESMKRNRSVVRVVAPKGWSKRVFNGLDDNEVVSLFHRLEGKGWDHEELKKQVLPRIKKEARRKQLEDMLGQQEKKAKGKSIKLDGHTLFPADDEFFAASDDESGDELTQRAMDFALEIVKSVKPPDINVYTSPSNNGNHPGGGDQ